VDQISYKDWAQRGKTYLIYGILLISV